MFSCQPGVLDTWRSSGRCSQGTACCGKEAAVASRAINSVAKRHSGGHQNARDHNFPYGHSLTKNARHVMPCKRCRAFVFRLHCGTPALGFQPFSSCAVKKDCHTGLHVNASAGRSLSTVAALVLCYMQNADGKLYSSLW